MDKADMSRDFDILQYMRSGPDLDLRGPEGTIGSVALHI